MAARGKGATKKILLVLLPIIVILLVVLLTIIQREEPAEIIGLIATTEPETEIEAVTETALNTGTKIEPVKEKGRLYFVIDDVGYNIEQLETFISLDCPMTFAILPFLPYSEEAANRIIADGDEFIIHMPMEPLRDEDPGPGALYTGMDSSEIRESAVEILNSLSGAKGVNNHMGSRFTSDEKSMDILLQVLKENGKFYLDSYTTADSVVSKVSSKKNMRYRKRDIFVDNNPETESIASAAGEGFVTAEKNGHAVLIGHVWSENLPGVIEKIYIEGVKKGFTFGHLSELYEEDGNS